MEKLNIFDAFAGVGGIRLGFEQASNKFKTIYAVDFEKKCKDTYDLNFKKAQLETNDISKLKINDIPDFDIITAGFPCFIAGTKVLTESGYKNIEDVIISDKLMTHTGEYQNIINLQQKLYENENDIYKIRAKYHPYAINCTSEHPFYVRKKNSIWNNLLRKYEYIFEDPIWVDAKNINKNH